jgi:hypothetical protein
LTAGRRGRTANRHTQTRATTLVADLVRWAKMLVDRARPPGVAEVGGLQRRMVQGVAVSGRGGRRRLVGQCRRAGQWVPHVQTGLGGHRPGGDQGKSRAPARSETKPRPRSPRPPLRRSTREPSSRTACGVPESRGAHRPPRTSRPVTRDRPTRLSWRAHPGNRAFRLTGTPTGSARRSTGRPLTPARRHRPIATGGTCRGPGGRPERCRGLAAVVPPTAGNHLPQAADS